MKIGEAREDLAIHRHRLLKLKKKNESIPFLCDSLPTRETFPSRSFPSKFPMQRTSADTRIRKDFSKSTNSPTARPFFPPALIELARADAPRGERRGAKASTSERASASTKVRAGSRTARRASSNPASRDDVRSVCARAPSSRSPRSNFDRRS